MDSATLFWDETTGLFHCDFTAERGQEPFMLSIAKTGNTRGFLFLGAPDILI